MVFQLSVAAQSPPPTLEVSPSTGLCAEPITVTGSSFPPGATVELTGIFDLIESTPLGSRTVTSDGAFEVAIPLDLLPSDCWQGRELLIRATVQGADELAATSVYLVEGPWQVTVEPARTDCSSPIEVRGMGFGPNDRVRIAWGPPGPAVEFDFAVLTTAQAGAAGEFAAPLDLSGRCAEAGLIGVYAWAVDDRGDPLEVGWAKATVETVPTASSATEQRTVPALEESSQSPSNGREVSTPSSSAGDGGLGASVVVPLLVMVFLAAILGTIALAILRLRRDRHRR
jgi:hypothetical protein